MSNIDFSRTITAEDRAAGRHASAVAALAALRWQRETGGLELDDGTRIATGRESQATLTGAVQLVSQGVVPAPVSWKTETGWMDLDLGALKRLAGAVAGHVQACFAAERTVLTEAGPALAEADLDAAFDAAYAAAVASGV